MSGNKGATLSRRGFLKSTAIGTVAAGGVAGLISGKLLPSDMANADNDERVAYTYHQSHCGGNCSLKCTVRDGFLCLIEPNDSVEDSHYSTCCLKGLSEVEHIYNPQRVKTPLKRVGERGKGEFEAISWDEAYSILKENLEEIWSKYGKGSVYVRASSESDEMSLLTSLLGAPNIPFGGIDMGIGSGFDPAFGGWGYCTAFTDSRDWINSDFMLNIGCNFLESSLIEGSRFFDAKESGCRIVTVDPHFCTTAQKSHEWIPIKPGTDAALFLGMISHILDNKYVDEEFIKFHTTLPFLIEKETGAFYSFDPEGDEAKQMNPMDPSPRAFGIWDSITNRAVSYSEQNVDPAIEGEFEIEGKTYVPAFVALEANQKPYTVAWASGITGIPEQKIIELAELYAKSSASILSMGLGGNDKMGNADVVGHAAAVLVCITGQAGRPGASAGSWAGGGALGAPYLGAGVTLPPNPEQRMILECTPVIRDPSYGMHAAVVVGDVLQQVFPEFGITEKWLSELDFICVMDVYHMTSADYADLVLPVCTNFESDEEVGFVKGANFHVRLREKVIDPLFESRPEYRIYRELAEALGLGEYFPTTAEEYARQKLANCFDPSLGDITIDSLKENNGIQPAAGYQNIRNSCPGAVFATKTTRAEVYYDNLLSFGQAFPNWEAPFEVGEDNPLRKKYPLQLVNGRSKYHIHNQFFDAAWIQEYSTGDCELNPSDMDAYGLQNGDLIRIFNDRGSVVLPVVGNASVRPGCLRAQEGIWSKYCKEGNLQNLTNSTLNERGKVLSIGPVIPFNDTLVAIERA